MTISKLDFKPFSLAIQQQFEVMQASKRPLVRTAVDNLGEFYVNAFPEGTNPIFRESTVYNCNCCKNFIRDVGNVVQVNADGSLVSIWDVRVEGYFQAVVDALSATVKAAPLGDIFYFESKSAGIKTTIDLNTDRGYIEYDHFFSPVAKSFKGNYLDIAKFNENFSMLEKSLDVLDLEFAELVLELIMSKSIPLGSQYKASVELFIARKTKYLALKTQKEKKAFLYETTLAHGSTVRIRNSLIGTLIEDLSKGKELNAAVASYGTKADPVNYKHTTAIATPGMVKKAVEALRTAGLDTSLQRRYATLEDIPSEEIIFSSTKPKALDVLDDALFSAEGQVSRKALKEAKTISMQDFLDNVLPSTTKLEIMVKNGQENHLMSLTTEGVKDSPRLFQWDNPVSHTYNGDVTDSMDQRIKSQGGEIDAFFRASLSWSNYDDLDIRARTPAGSLISFAQRECRTTGGCLDVDMNPGGGRVNATMMGSKYSRTPVENIYWKDRYKLVPGVYVISVNNYTKVETADTGFTLKLVLGDRVVKLHSPVSPNTSQTVEVARVSWDGKEFTYTTTLATEEDSLGTPRDIWSIQTNTFVPVTTLIKSPNFWDNKEYGNKHLFFLIEGCKNPDSAKGFYNEYLRTDLHEYRKFLEVLSTKTKVPYSDNQASGVGFSIDKASTITVRATGKSVRIFNIIN